MSTKSAWRPFLTHLYLVITTRKSSHLLHVLKPYIQTNNFCDAWCLIRQVFPSIFPSQVFGHPLFPPGNHDKPIKRSKDAIYFTKAKLQSKSLRGGIHVAEAVQKDWLRPSVIPYLRTFSTIPVFCNQFLRMFHVRPNFPHYFGPTLHVHVHLIIHHILRSQHTRYPLNI